MFVRLGQTRNSEKPNVDALSLNRRFGLGFAFAAFSTIALEITLTRILDRFGQFATIGQLFLHKSYELAGRQERLDDPELTFQHCSK